MRRSAPSNPRLVLCSITGYGQDGPYAARAGHDLDYCALAGLLALTGPPERPLPLGVQVADLAGGAWPAVAGVLAALVRRATTGEGAHVDVSMTEGALALLALPLAMAWARGTPLARGRELLSGGAACYGVYRTKDGRFVALGALEPKFFAAFCAAVGRPELARAAARGRRRRPARGARGDLRGADARRVGGVRGGARRVPRAGARGRRAARGPAARRARRVRGGADAVGGQGDARDRDARCGSAARPRRAGPRRGSASTARRCCARPGSRRRRSRRSARPAFSAGETRRADPGGRPGDWLDTLRAGRQSSPVRMRALVAAALAAFLALTAAPPHVHDARAAAAAHVRGLPVAHGGRGDARDARPHPFAGPRRRGGPRARLAARGRRAARRDPGSVASRRRA